MNSDNYIIQDEADLCNAILYGDVTKVVNYQREWYEDYQYFFKVHWPCGEIHIYDREGDKLKLVGFGKEGWIMDEIQIKQ